MVSVGLFAQYYGLNSIEQIENGYLKFKIFAGPISFDLFGIIYLDVVSQSLEIGLFRLKKEVGCFLEVIEIILILRMIIACK